MSQMFNTNLLCLLSIACITVLITVPAHAFTANSLDITIDKSGDATATFRFTLEGFLENAIPQSMLEEELKKGLTTNAKPPVLLSMDRSGATMLLKNFADTRDVEQGTEYRTAQMNFLKAEIALKNSALSSVVTADFSPDAITITFPDASTRRFENVAVLPSVTHVVIDPSKPAAALPSPTGRVNVTASPAAVQVSIDGSYAGETPQTFSDIPAGAHTFLFQKDGFVPVTKTVTVVEGRTTSLFVYLQYIAEPAATRSGILPVPGFGPVMACLAIGGCVLMRKITR
jgi:hypothetical protein